MSDLSDERVREIAEAVARALGFQSPDPRYSWPSDDEVCALAREVLALRAEVATLTRQRDEAVAVALEAVGGLLCENLAHNPSDVHRIGTPCPVLERLCARLAALTPTPEETTDA
jgi:hypothetical protein